jgi:hypothetical protein
MLRNWLGRIKAATRVRDSPVRERIAFVYEAARRISLSDGIAED